jgi:hypothetical protein
MCIKARTINFVKVLAAQGLVVAGALIVAAVTYQIALPHYKCAPHEWLCLAPLAAGLDAVLAAAIVYAVCSPVAFKLLRVRQWLPTSLFSVASVLATGYELSNFTYQAYGLTGGYLLDCKGKARATSANFALKYWKSAVA